MNIWHTLHHWLVPHQTNNHRAKALHHNVLLVYVFVFLLFNLMLKVVHKTLPDVLGYATDIRVDALLSGTNAKRAEQGLSPLALNSTLSEAAAAKAADMFANNYWAHNSPSGKTPWDFIIGSGYRYTLAGENLAKNFQTSGGVVDAWMGSPTHRANIVKAGYQEVGFAIVNGTLNGEETTLVVQMFGATKSAPVAKVPQVQAQEPQTQAAQTQPATVVPTEPAAAVSTPAPTAIPTVAPAPSLTRITTSPLINISAVSRQVVFIFVGILIGVLALDAYVVSKRRVVRLTGHNIAHILFLFTIIIGGLLLTHGTLL